MRSAAEYSWSRKGSASRSKRAARSSALSASGAREVCSVITPEGSRSPPLPPDGAVAGPVGRARERGRVGAHRENRAPCRDAVRASRNSCMSA
ncbi:hypothetical protein NUM3379_10970 [Kineococcus sp. NUM-3379]